MVRRTDTHETVVAELPRLRAFARFLTGDAQSAEDLVQDSLERALAGLRQRRQDTSLRAWLFAICRHRHVDLLRRRNRRPDGRSIEEGIHWPVAEEPTSEEFLNDLNRAMRRLPTDLQEVMWLVAINGFTYEEAAGIMEVPTGTIRSRVFRARGILKNELSSYWASRHDGTEE